MQYYNVHSHSFTMNNVPSRFLNIFMPDVAAFVLDRITNTKPGSAALGWLLSHLGGNLGQRYASFLQIGKSKNQLEVFEKLIHQYDDETLKFIILAMYMEKSGAGISPSGYEGQIEELLTIKKQYPDRMLIFLAIDPRWKLTGKDLRRTVQSYFEKKISVNATRSVYPFTGLKMYPSTGFYVFDERLKETFEWAADNGVPVLSHCNYLGGIFHNDKDYVEANLNPMNPYTGKRYDIPAYIDKSTFKKKLLGTNKGTNNKYSCSYFLEPAGYEAMIAYFDANRAYFDKSLEDLDKLRDPLKICLAHFGGGNQIKASLDPNPEEEEKHPYGTKDINWHIQVKDLMRQYKGTYSDISYAVYDTKVHQPILDALNDPAIGDRIMFGTDFFLTERELEEKDIYGGFKKTAINTPLTNFNNVLAWDQVAGTNPRTFLQSKYYSG